MERQIATALRAALVGGVVAWSVLGPGAAAAVDAGWPREIEKEGSALVYFQPQLDSWEKQRVLRARMAITLTLPGGKPPLAGAVWIRGDTAVDLDTRTVLIENIAIERVSFSVVDKALAQSAEQAVRAMVPNRSVSVSLDRILAGMKQTEQAAAKPIPVNNDAPAIHVSQTPARLLMFDGEPVFTAVPGTKLQYVLNTNWTVFNVPATTSYYLLDGKTWLTADNLNGPWKLAPALPGDFVALPADDNFKDARDNIPPGKPQYGTPPKLYVATAPAELIVIEGRPQLEHVGAAGLKYVKNTDADLFHFDGDGKWYYLVAGRWYRAASLDGPWSFASAELPAAFAGIPAAHAKARVLYSVPGTPQAQEAVLVAGIPQKATVRIDKAQTTVVYTGTPVFVPIQGTTMYYAQNASVSVIKLSETGYYACDRGVWFVAATPAGPWTVATSVPQVIYTIPSSVPVYNVTYVTQTQTSPTTVESAYTAGFLGGFVVGGLLFWGAGHYYPPYWYYPPRPVPVPVYYPRPYTWGASAWYNPATNTYYRGGGAYGPYGGFGAGAAYNPATGAYARGYGAYGPYGGFKVGHAYNPTTGAWATGAAGYGPYGSYRAARGYNPSTGTGVAARQGSNVYGDWGQAVVVRGGEAARVGYRSTDEGTVAGARTTKGTGAIGVQTDSGQRAGAVKGENNTYVGHDGNVYRKTDSGWQKYEDGGWESVAAPQGQPRTQAKTQSAQSRQGGTGGAAGEPAAVSQPAQQPARQAAPQPARQPVQQPVQQPARDIAAPASATAPAAVAELERESANRSVGEQRTQAWNREYRSRGGVGDGGGRTGGRRR